MRYVLFNSDHSLSLEEALDILLVEDFSEEEYSYDDYSESTAAPAATGCFILRPLGSSLNAPIAN